MSKGFAVCPGSNQGFTLVELMVSIFLASILTVTFYAIYLMQQRSYVTQGQVVEMQQNIRTGLQTMVREIRLAGYDPQGTAFAGTVQPIIAAYPDLFSFAADLDGNGRLSDKPKEKAEYFAYDCYQSGSGSPSLGRASSASGPIAIRQKSSGHRQAVGHQPVAESIEKVEFAYLLDDGSLVSEASDPADLRRIRSVRISMLAKTAQADSRYKNTAVYTTASGTIWDPEPDDGFRRRLVISQVDLRNRGLWK